MCQQIVLGGQRNAFLFAGRDAGAGTAKSGMTAQAHFDKYQCVSVTCNDVDFAAADTEIAIKDFQPVREQMVGGQRFGSSTRTVTCVIRHACSKAA